MSFSKCNNNCDLIEYVSNLHETKWETKAQKYLAKKISKICEQELAHYKITNGLRKKSLENILTKYK